MLPLKLHVMKKHFYTLSLAIALLVIFSSCSVFSHQAQEQDKGELVDPVCGMSVKVADAYSYKYKGKKYYFDNYSCKQSFKMNPEKFINKVCIPADSLKTK